jgi:acyl carrier protein
MTTAEIYDALTLIFQDVFLRDDLVLKPTLSAKDVPGWDSFKQIEIILATEQHFGIKLTTREVERLTNVGDLVSVVMRYSSHSPPSGA